MINALKRLIYGDDKLKLADGRVLLGNTKGEASWVSLSGDLTLNSEGSFSIGAGKIVYGAIGASAVVATGFKYSLISIRILCSTTDAVLSHNGADTVTAGYVLLGAWVETCTSLTDFGGSFMWVATQGTNSIRVSINGPNPRPTGCGLVFKGIVLNA